MVFSNARRRAIRVGALGRVTIEPGYLVYVGSAFGPGGIRARVARHARKSKKLHWHIDYLRRYLALEEVWLTAAPARHEHDWAKRLEGNIHVAFPRFGASDCRCASHLFFAADRPSLDIVGGIERIPVSRSCSSRVSTTDAIGVIPVASNQSSA